MNTSKTEEKVLFKKQFDNGVDLSCYDRSRKIAADRWQLRLHCEIIIPVNTNYFDRYKALPSDEIAAVREALGSHIVFTATKKRNFVDAEGKETILAAFVKQVTENMLTYVVRNSFPEKLFVQHFDKYRKELLLRREIDNANDTTESAEEEPLDFSSCFKD